jgi:hypothetical protein
MGTISLVQRMLESGPDVGLRTRHRRDEGALRRGAKMQDADPGEAVEKRVKQGLAGEWGNDLNPI